MKELLIKLRESVELELGENMGICDCVWPIEEKGFITSEQRRELYTWLMENLPNKEYPCVYNNIIFCWKMNDKESRLNWLDEQIETLKK